VPGRSSAPFCGHTTASVPILLTRANLPGVLRQRRLSIGTIRMCGRVVQKSPVSEIGCCSRRSTRSRTRRPTSMPRRPSYCPHFCHRLRLSAVRVGKPIHDPDCYCSCESSTQSLRLSHLALAFGITIVGITGLAGFRCSGTATASVVTAHGRIGPKGTSAEHRPGLSDERYAITLKFGCSCWVATSFSFSGRARGGGPHRGSFLASQKR
jgi:hypothetical protein